MLAGELYRPDAELGADQAATKAWLVRYNAALALPVSQRHALLRERLAHVGEDAVIRPPFFCDYGYNIRLGDNVFLNFNCVILDVVEVSIGDRTQIGPAVQIYAADHPRDAETRRDHRRRRGDRGRQRGHTGRRRRPDRDRQSGPASPPIDQPLVLTGLCDFPGWLLWNGPMFARRTIRISGPASA